MESIFLNLNKHLNSLNTWLLLVFRIAFALTVCFFLFFDSSFELLRLIAIEYRFYEVCLCSSSLLLSYQWIWALVIQYAGCFLNFFQLQCLEGRKRVLFCFEPLIAQWTNLVHLVIWLLVVLCLASSTALISTFFLFQN